MRLLGAALVLLGFVSAGICRVRAMERRADEFRELAAAMELLTLLLGQYALPTVELCQYLAQNASGAGGALFARLYDSMQKQADERLFTLWKQALAPLQGEEKQPLTEFGRVLGCLSAQRQCDAARRCRQSLEKLAEEAQLRRCRYGRVCLALYAAGGALITIVTL